MTRYLTFDVFTGTAFGGNPLAVIPDATALPEASFQAIAREFNYSETTFVLPPSDPAHTARVQIFTPGMELPFAGHPVIGTAVALARMGQGPEMTFELGIGPLAVHGMQDAARFVTRMPFLQLGSPEPGLLADCLGLSAAQIAGAPVHGGVGLDFVLVELADRAALAAARPDPAAFARGKARHPDGRDFAILAHVGRTGDIDARMFAPLDGIPEDPATGSAAAALGAWLGPGRYVIRQGVDMGRPSRIDVMVTDDLAVTIAGEAVPVMEGRLLI